VLRSRQGFSPDGRPATVVEYLASIISHCDRPDSGAENRLCWPIPQDPSPNVGPAPPARVGSWWRNAYSARLWCVSGARRTCGWCEVTTRVQRGWRFRVIRLLRRT